MKSITFTVESDETGGFVARWDDPSGGGIATQGETVEEVLEMIRDAVAGYFADGVRPSEVRVHFSDDPVLALA